jgi:AcrR family transcriptional regulator
MFASSGLRTSLQDIADACGIQPGSLYHHFESKESIVIELVRRYHAELDHVAEIALKELDGLDDSDPRRVADRIERLGAAIAHCAVRHSAAVQISFYEPPAGSSHELVQLASRAPSAAESAVLETLRIGRSSGFIWPGIDLAMLSDRFCQTMLHVGLGLYHRYPTVDRVAGLLCKIMMYGVAAGSPANADLDRSAALQAVESVLRSWQEDDEATAGDRTALIREAARAEFGRRGYEGTTIRDIASAAGLSTAGVYRVIGSKEELLASIMSSFAEKVMAGWNAALGSGASAAEKLDAVAWLQINVLEQFSREFNIQLSWMRQSPPDIPNPGWAFTAVVRRLKDLMREGARSGEISIGSPATRLTALCVLDLTWIPENIVRTGGKRTALILARDTLLRGAARG